MDDLISRKALLDIVENKYRDIVAGAYPFNIVAYDLSKIIKEQPTVEAVPVVHGEWLEASMNYVCSHCKTEFHDDIEWIQGCDHELPNFCPECGADMRKKVQDGKID